MALKKYLDFAKPKEGYSKGVYYILNVLLPIIVLILVLMGFAWLAALAVLFAKWRMFAMRPRYWLPNIRANSVDIFVGLSVVVFLAGTQTFFVQVFWTVFYLFWVIILKPRSDQISVMVQALISQGLASVAFYQAFPDHQLWVGVLVMFAICYVSARHFLGAFDEPQYRQISALWAWFGASLTWVLEHWLIEYLTISQVSLIITLVGYTLAFMYYMHANHKLKNTIRSQLMFTLMIILLIVIVFSDWQDKTI
jgi:hypothetical protein